MRRARPSIVSASAKTDASVAGSLVVDRGVEVGRRVHEVVAARVEVRERIAFIVPPRQMANVFTVSLSPIDRADVDGRQRAQPQVVVEA